MTMARKIYVPLVFGFLVFLTIGAFTAFYFKSHANEYSRKSYIHSTLAIKVVDYYESNGKYPETTELLSFFEDNLSDDVWEIGYVVGENKASIHWKVSPYQGQFICFYEGKLIFDSTTER
jgi:hypothetical protein